MTLPELQALSDEEINRMVAAIHDCEEGDEDDGHAPGSWFFPEDDYALPHELEFAWSWDAINGAVRVWTNGDGEREAAILNALPTADRTIRAMVLFDLAPRDLCHALILASETK